MSLLEITAGLVLLSVMVMSYGMTLVHGVEQRRETMIVHQAMVILRDVVAEIQDVANRDPDFTTGDGVTALYSEYNGQTLTDLALRGVEIDIVVYADEANVPLELGGPQDLNLDGDSADDLGNESNGTDLLVVPMEFTLVYQESGFQYTLTRYRLFTRTTND